MGELAASIAHEVNQPLAAVITNGNAALRWLAAPTPNVPEAREAVQRIIRDGHRAGEVIQRVRALLTKTGPQKAWLDINAVIQEVLTLAHSEVHRQRVALRTELAAGLPPVWGDRIQLQQVLLNLLMNGMEAMRAVAERSRQLRIRSGTQGPQDIFVAVQDSGLGLDAQTLDRIFDAFYTTKPDGMGMGLSISRTIIEAHGGRLWATPDDGGGATLQFTLPLHGACQS
jgi:signal transduction histidine kinase